MCHLDCSKDWFDSLVGKEVPRLSHLLLYFLDLSQYSAWAWI